MLLGNESPFELLHSANCRNDRILEYSNMEVPATEMVNFPVNVMALVMVSYPSCTYFHKVRP